MQHHRHRVEPSTSRTGTAPTGAVGVVGDKLDASKSDASKSEASKLELVGRVAALGPLVDRWLAYQQWYRQIPSLAVGISVGGTTVLATGHGLADPARRLQAGPDVRYRVASHSKVFTATAIMRLVAQGHLQLDDPVSRHLAWFASAAERVHSTGSRAADLGSVTIRQLLSHSSGLTRDGISTHWHDGAFPDRDAIMAQVDTMAVLAPLDGLKYSNIAYTLAGQIIEHITGESYERHITDTILGPLGLTRTTPDLPDDEQGRADHAAGFSLWRPDEPRRAVEPMAARVMNSATGFSSSVNDLLRWYQAHRTGSGELLEDRHKREMQRVQFEGGGMRWGIGFQLASIAGLDFCSHGGGYPGFISYSGFNPGHEVAMVVLTSAIDGPAGELFAGLAGLVKRSIDGAFDEPGNGSDPTGGFETAADSVSGFYPAQWRDTLVARVGGSMATIVPSLLDPAASLQVLEPVSGDGAPLRFRYPRNLALASPGEELWLEPGPTPRLHAPSHPPLDRRDPWAC